VILCTDDENVRSVAGRIDRRIVTFGLSEDAAVRAENIRQVGLQTTFDVLVRDHVVGSVELPVPGLHNLKNALAAFAVGLELDVPVREIIESLNEFSGVQRRFEILTTAGDVIVVDDYAHHPAEVAATLQTASRVWPGRRIVAAFQPHLYSRTRDLAEDLAHALSGADVLVVTNVYGAREEPVEGITGELLVDLARASGHERASYVENVADLPAVLLEHAKPGDAVFLMGAGDIWRQSRVFAAAVATQEQETT
jgi:UDP-N-acetylmuramate--alanine ligase